MIRNIKTWFPDDYEWGATRPGKVTRICVDCRLRCVCIACKNNLKLIDITNVTVLCEKCIWNLQKSNIVKAGSKISNNTLIHRPTVRTAKRSIHSCNNCRLAPTIENYACSMFLRACVPDSQNMENSMSYRPEKDTSFDRLTIVIIAPQQSAIRTVRSLTLDIDYNLQVEYK